MADVLAQRRNQIEAAIERRASLEAAGIQNDSALTPEFIFCNTRNSAGRVKKLLDERLASRQAYLNCSRVKHDVFKEVKYYKLLIDLYEKNVKLMNCVVAYLNEEISNGRKRQQDLDKLYVPLINWLNNMEKETRRVLDLPSSEIGEKFEALRIHVVSFLEMVRGSFAAHPKKYAAVVGAVAGGALLHNYFAGACVSTKILAQLGLVQCGCASVGWGAALAVGALGGVFLVLLGTCLYTAFSDDTEEIVGDADMRAEPSFPFVDVNIAVDNMKNALINLENDALEQELRKIAAYWDQFNDFNPSIDTEPCPVCLEAPLQPVRFRGCLGRHFHCFECREACLHANPPVAGGACTICRHPPEA